MAMFTSNPVDHHRYAQQTYSARYHGYTREQWAAIDRYTNGGTDWDRDYRRRLDGALVEVVRSGHDCGRDGGVLLPSVPVSVKRGRGGRR